MRVLFIGPVTNFLCGLPLTGLYHGIYYLWYGYCLRFKLSSMKSFRKEIPIYTKLFFRMLAKS